MHSNSIIIYKDSILPTLPKRQKLVYQTIKKLNRATCREVASFLNVPVNTISGRFIELKRKNAIEQVDNVKIGSSRHGVYSIKKQ